MSFVMKLGPVAPMKDGEFANEIPDFPGECGGGGSSSGGLKDQAAATGTEDFTGVVSVVITFYAFTLTI